MTELEYSQWGIDMGAGKSAPAPVRVNGPAVFIDGDGNEAAEADEVLEVRLRPNADRLKGLSGKAYRSLQSDPNSQFEFLALFMVDANGGYLSKDAAFAILDQLTVEQIGAAIQQLSGVMGESAAPKASGRPSTKARISTYK